MSLFRERLNRPKSSFPNTAILKHFPSAILAQAAYCKLALSMAPDDKPAPGPKTGDGPDGKVAEVTVKAETVAEVRAPDTRSAIETAVARCGGVASSPFSRKTARGSAASATPRAAASPTGRIEEVE